MEILNKLQYELEDALRIEVDYEDVKSTKEGKRLLKYLRRRRRIVNRLVKIWRNLI